MRSFSSIKPLKSNICIYFDFLAPIILPVTCPGTVSSCMRNHTVTKSTRWPQKNKTVSIPYSFVYIINWFEFFCSVLRCIFFIITLNIPVCRIYAKYELTYIVYNRLLNSTISSTSHDTRKRSITRAWAMSMKSAANDCFLSLCDGISLSLSKSTSFNENRIPMSGIVIVILSVCISRCALFLRCITKRPRQKMPIASNKLFAASTVQIHNRRFLETKVRCSFPRVLGL